MSFDLVSAVFRWGPRQHLPFTVLLSMAHSTHHRDIDPRTGARCWPSIEKLAVKARCTPRAVQNAIGVLEREGWLTVEPHAVPRKNGSGAFNRYTLSLARLRVALPAASQELESQEPASPEPASPELSSPERRAGEYNACAEACGSAMDFLLSSVENHPLPEPRSHEPRSTALNVFIGNKNLRTRTTAKAVDGGEKQNTQTPIHQNPIPETRTKPPQPSHPAPDARTRTRLMEVSDRAR